MADTVLPTSVDELESKEDIATGTPGLNQFIDTGDNQGAQPVAEKVAQQSASKPVHAQPDPSSSTSGQPTHTEEAALKVSLPLKATNPASSTLPGDPRLVETPIGPSPSPAASARPYVQQFSRFSADALQRILSGVKREPTAPVQENTTLFSRHAGPPLPRDNGREDSVSNLPAPTPMTLHMPTPVLQAPRIPDSFSTSSVRTTALVTASLTTSKSASGALSAIQRVIQGATPSRSGARKASQNKPPAGESKLKKTKVIVKPRRSKNQGENDDTSGLSSLSDLSEGDPAHSATATPTVTKSGRQVTKPSTYNPVAVDQGAKKRQRAERSGKPPLCKRCTRWPSFDHNKIVICDECLAPWHQRCHTPNIPSDAVGDDVHWVCDGCKSEQPPKKVKIHAREDVNGANQPHVKLKRPASLTLEDAAMADPALVPDLPFSGDTDSDVASQDSRASDANAWSKGRRRREEPQEYDEYEYDFLPRAWPPWPAAGQGFYAMLPPEKEDQERLVDFQDQALSHFVYDEAGNVVWRNGKAVDRGKLQIEQREARDAGRAEDASKVEDGKTKG